MLTLIAIVLALLVLPAPWGVILVVVAAVVDIAETGALVRWTRRRRPTVGPEALVGRVATVVSPLTPGGRVKLDGELWVAHGATPIAVGRTVVVRRVDGLSLEVEEVPAEAEAGAP